MGKIRFATVWLDGCSGCHMSFLDIDERLIDLADKVEVVCSPYVDHHGEFPDNIDLVLIEGAVSSEEDLHKLKLIRKKAKKIIALGDCAVTGNVTAMRNICGLENALDRAYNQLADLNNSIPATDLPVQLEKVLPLNEVVKIDYFVPGCPPPADAIFETLSAIVEGRRPEIEKYTRFGK
jgi:NAD-reducing hydrogenase small subunit